MDFSVVEVGNKQYKVVAGQEFTLEKVQAKPGEKLTFDKVLLVKEGEKIKVGTPYVKGAKVQVEVIAQKKGPKIRVARYHAKSRHRRVLGHRQQLTQVKVVSGLEKTAKSRPQTKVKPKKSRPKRA